MCKAVNAAGEAVTSGTLHCTPKEAIILTPQQPASLARVAELEAPKPLAEVAPDKPKGPPTFVTQLADLGEVPEGHAAHFEANVTPQDDNTLRIQWFLNGHPVAASSRLKMVNDFGFCVLVSNGMAERSVCRHCYAPILGYPTCGTERYRRMDV